MNKHDELIEVYSLIEMLDRRNERRAKLLLEWYMDYSDLGLSWNHSINRTNEMISYLKSKYIRISREIITKLN